SKEFNALLYQLMIEDTSNEFLHIEKLKLQIAMQREVVISVCGFFNLDYTLLYSMIASATTYLVIFIQFGEPGSMVQQPTLIDTANLTTTTLPLINTT
ncbi:Gustatory receptor 55, partial [Halyomorpha halys]